MVKELVISTLLLSGCTIFSPQNELYKELNEPTPLEEIDITLYKKNFLMTGWICAEKAGYPAFFHPFILTVFGCADVHWQDGKVIKCDVWYSGDWILEHELNHCRGYDD